MNIFLKVFGVFVVNVEENFVEIVDWRGIIIKFNWCRFFRGSYFSLKWKILIKVEGWECYGCNFIVKFVFKLVY